MPAAPPTIPPPPPPPVVDAASHFAGLDWFVLLGYLALLVVTGLVFTRKQRSTDDYFLAGRRMPSWAVATSILATALSAATFIGGPQFAYEQDLTYIGANVASLLAIVFVAFVIVPACYKRNLTTVYELLDRRFGPTTRRAAGVMYMLGRTLAIGARGYIGALPASLIIWGDLDPAHVATAVVVLTSVGVLYTIVGGIGTVIWTDFIQMCVFLVAAFVAVYLLLDRIPASTGEIASGLAADAKLTLVDFSFDLTKPYTFVSVLLALTLFSLGSYGTDQDMVQRMLTCKSAIAGARSAILGAAVAVPVTLLFLIIGLLLYVFFQRPDLMGGASPHYETDDSRKVFLSFILREMPAGLSGLMIAGLFAAGLSSVNSTLNAMSATVIADFYKPLRPGKSERHYLAASRIAVVCWGVAIAGVGVLSIFWQKSESSTLLDFALGVMAYAYAGLVAVFLSATLTKRGNTVSALAAFAVGIVAVTVMQPAVWTALAGSTGRASGTGSTGGEPLPLAWPWRFFVATALAFATCQLGSNTRARSASEELTP
ncbi:MAG: sodium:solute symporter [Planctomycetota bacterium]|nr:sodium:solute symporter [Planctomycetota bacterium]